MPSVILQQYHCDDFMSRSWTDRGSIAKPLDVAQGGFWLRRWTTKSAVLEPVVKYKVLKL